MSKKKLPIAIRINRRIEKKRLDGLNAAQIGRYAKSVMSQFRICADQIDLTKEEARMTLPTLPEMVAKQRAEAARAKTKKVDSADRAVDISLKPDSRLPRGLTVKDVRALLECSLTELNRWEADGRLPADGLRHFHIGKSLWARAWLPETIENAKSNVPAWRERDRSARGRKRTLSLVSA